MQPACFSENVSQMPGFTCIQSRQAIHREWVSLSCNVLCLMTHAFNTASFKLKSSLAAILSGQRRAPSPNSKSSSGYSAPSPCTTPARMIYRLVVGLVGSTSGLLCSYEIELTTRRWPTRPYIASILLADRADVRPLLQALSFSNKGDSYDQKTRQRHCK